MNNSTRAFMSVYGFIFIVAISSELELFFAFALLSFVTILLMVGSLEYFLDKRDKKIKKRKTARCQCSCHDNNEGICYECWENNCGVRGL